MTAPETAHIASGSFQGRAITPRVLSAAIAQIA